MQIIKTLRNKHQPAAKTRRVICAVYLLLNLSWNTECVRKDDAGVGTVMILFFHSSCPVCRSLSRKALYQQHCLPHHFPCLCLLMPSSTSPSDLLYNGLTVNDIQRVWRHLLRKLPKHQSVMSKWPGPHKICTTAPVKTLQNWRITHKVTMPVVSSFSSLNQGCPNKLERFSIKRDHVLYDGVFFYIYIQYRASYKPLHLSMPLEITWNH